MPRSVSIESMLTPADFDQVWDYLEKKFGYSKEWRAKCYHYMYERKPLHSYRSDPVRDFLFFCRFHIDPLLNAALCRNEHHPTIVGLLQWMFRDRIETGKK